MLVFAGTDAAYLGYNDVFALSLAGTSNWAQLAPAETPPAARSYSRAIYDPARNRMVVFGGFCGGLLNDVWTLSLHGTPTWSQLAPAGHLRAPAPATPRSTIRRATACWCSGIRRSFRNDVWGLSLSETPT